MKSFWRIIRYARPYRVNAFLNIFFNLLGIVFSLVSIALIIPVLGIIFDNAKTELVQPVFEGSIIDYGKAYLEYEVALRMQDTGQSDALMYVCFIVIIAFFLKNLFGYLALYFITPMRNGITRDLRKELHAKILALPIGFFSEQRKGDIISRMTTDMKEVEWSILMALEMVFREPIMIISSLVVLLWMSPALTVFVFILLPVVSVVVTTIGKSLKRSSQKAQMQVGGIMSQTEESITGLKVIKAFNAEPLKRNLFQRSVDSYFNTMNRVMRKTALSSPISEFLGVSVMAVVIWYGGGLVLANEGFTPEAFIAYIVFFYQIIPPAKTLSKASYNVQRGNAASERILEILDAENPITSKADAVSISSFDKELKFENVSFAYEEKNVVNNVSLTVEKGKMVALVGQSGSGKTTLTNLVPRFYDVTDGQLLIDGKDVRDVKLHDLRGLLGIVTQESLLFNESVFYNITLGKPEATLEEVQQAAKIANAHDFIMGLEKGYDTNIGDAGGKLSGGQKQRISIARAVLKNPPILILDEATSALDTESEKLVQEALFKLMQNRTSLVIAHRLSTIQHADEIVVMNEGQIAERGTHQELLDKNGIYSRLVEMQKFD
ncbi:ABC transporter ATP-binding protein [Owenweeksia hongkongensis]|uniref:ABC transporter ATP-binding protein n=1 Tax=Owenweeksia hongkongensis TaxID=253245 RepID=UPI003A8D5916